MGSNSSSLTEDVLDEYSQLTYLHRTEILQIFKRFYGIDPSGVRTSMEYRIRGEEIMEEFHEIKCNPYGERLIDVFSSYNDGHFSLEDTLDLFSAFSKNCPVNVKALWMFKVLDVNDDGMLDAHDLVAVLGRLCRGGVHKHRYSRRPAAEDDHSWTLSPAEKKDIAEKVINEIDLGKTGSITANEFVHAVMKMPDFSRTFTMRP